MDNTIDTSAIDDLKQRVKNKLDETQLFTYRGSVSKLLGLTVEVKLPGLKIGDLCFIETYDGKQKPAEVQAFKGEVAQLSLLLDGEGIGQGSLVTSTGRPITIPVGDFLLGRLIDPMGNPIDGRPLDIENAQWRNIEGPPPGPLERPIITEQFSTGVRAIDGCMTMGCGQRLGLFAGSGVGKSTLLGMIARNSDADVNVVALIGERGREVKEFVEDALGEVGMAKSVLVCSTGDKPPLIRQKCLLTATAVCEYFRDQGKKVFLMTDTITRCAMAGREVGLSLGEPPTMKGYPPSIFSWLQKALERAGNSEKGSITALYTVLMEGDDINDPIVDIVRGIVDGHIFLSRKVAEANHYPAIDVLGSISRLMSAIASPEHKQAAAKLRTIMSLYRENKDLIDVGMYQPGSNPRLDTAIEMMPKINAFLQQRTDDSVTMEGTIGQLVEMMQDVEI
ncbi:FliI/YscN family ATPase [bacterium]|nr:FliI/YscN family ATPase [bacterium]